jgi:hypothetical protein
LLRTFQLKGRLREEEEHHYTCRSRRHLVLTRLLLVGRTLLEKVCLGRRKVKMKNTWVRWRRMRMNIPRRREKRS